MAVKTVHFRVGHDAGKLIMQIAQEHLIHNLDPEKAMKTITESLCGIPEDLALSVLSGDHVIEVDIEDQEFVVYKRDEDKHQDFPQLNFVRWYHQWHDKIPETASALYKALGDISYDLRKGILINFDIESIASFIKGDFIDIENDLNGDKNLIQLSELILSCDEYLLFVSKKYQVLEWLVKNYNSSFFWDTDSKGDICVVENKDFLKERYEIVDLLTYRLEKVKDGKVGEVKNIAADQVDMYFENQKNIEKQLHGKITPNDIKDLYNASWIAPNGDHYGINGEISNMLHIQLADKLMSDGIVVLPEGEFMQPDTWMRQDGWVTIHNGWVLYDGYYHSKEITPEQQKAIYLFGQHYAYKTGKMPIFGIKRVPMTGARFEILEQFQLKQLFGL